MLSIWCSTYNHESYIRDAIESFLMQNVKFRYEIIIHDDASGDRTNEIIKEYERKYPNLVYGIYQVENQWGKNHPCLDWIYNIIRQNCKGKYIALCEGDDYWIDRNKLQIQVDYLEMHPECIATIHDAINMDCRDRSIRGRGLYSENCVLPAGEIITQKRVQVPTASIIYRRQGLEMNDFFLQAGIGDYPNLLYCLTKGYIYYFSRFMSVYRSCHAGSWSESMDQNKEKRVIQLILCIDFLMKYNKYSNGHYESHIIEKIQICVDDVFASLGKQDLKEFSEICHIYDEKGENKYHEIWSQIERIYSQIYDEDFLGRNFYRFINKHKKIIIMGAGRYAGIIAKQIKNSGFDYEGFVVSNNQKAEKEYLGKPVWKFRELKFDKENVGIIVGINPTIWVQIMDALKNFNPENYICPFLLNMKEER